jgi:hypothetical protein
LSVRWLAPFAFVSLAPLVAQLPPMPATPAMRYVDFHRDLARQGVVVVVGTLGKGKEGRREKLADGKLGGGNVVTVISGTQFFKVPVQAPIQPRATFAGKCDKVAIAYDLQVARLPDGKEQRQSTTSTAAPMDEGMLALFVLAPADKKKVCELLHVIPFDKKVDTGPDAEAVFVDTMADHHAVNRRVLDYENALAAAETAADDASRTRALESLQQLVDAPLRLRRSENDGLLLQHVNPRETRAKQRLAAAAAKPAAEPAGSKQ